MIHGCAISLFINGKILHWFAFIYLSRNILHKEATEAGINVLMLRAVIHLSLHKISMLHHKISQNGFPKK